MKANRNPHAGDDELFTRAQTPAQPARLELIDTDSFMVNTYVVTVTIQDPADPEFSLDCIAVIHAPGKSYDILPAMVHACLKANGRNPETCITQEITITTNPPELTL